MDRRRSRWWMLLFAAAVLAGCAGTQGVAPVRERAGRPPRVEQPQRVAPGHHLVGAGDTLYSIAFQYGYSYQELAAWNGIPSPYVIYKGQQLRVVPPAQRPPPPVPARSMPPPVSAPPAAAAAAPRPEPRRAEPDEEPDAASGGPIHWAWPAAGRVMRGFSAAEPGRRGIDIGGSLGQPIQASADGRVVYSGSGLTGYGNLIIIKHDKTFLSAYGYNRNLLVKEGDRVRRGQRIADMGRNASNVPMLHFEIRRDGKPVDPARYLPPR